MVRLMRGHVVALLCVALAACSGPKPAGIVVRDAWSRQSPTMAGSGAVFMVIENPGPAPDALIGATTDICDAVELHESRMEGDVMKMQPVAGGRIEVPAGGLVELKSGGLHVMLIGLKEPLEPGDTFGLELQFEEAGNMTIQVPVREAGAMGSGG